MNYENKLLQEFHFTIGEQFEVNEFNVKTENSIFVGGLEYEMLFYNTDILSVFKYEFNTDLLDELLKKLYSYLPTAKASNNNKIECKIDSIFLMLKVMENCIELYVSNFKLQN